MKLLTQIFPTIGIGLASAIRKFPEIFVGFSTPAVKIHCQTAQEGLWIGYNTVIVRPQMEDSTNPTVKNFVRNDGLASLLPQIPPNFLGQKVGYREKQTVGFPPKYTPAKCEDSQLFRAKSKYMMLQLRLWAYWKSELFRKLEKPASSTVRNSQNKSFSLLSRG